MHGEAWVNTAIQEADLLIALGMRFDDRVTGNLKTYAPHARRRFTSTSIAPSSTRTCASTSAIAKDLRAALDEWLPHVEPGDRSRVARAHRRAQGRLRGPRHPESARRRPSVCGARDQRPLAAHRRQRASSSPTSASTRCGKRSTTSTNRRARSSPRAASARWASRCRRRSAPRSRCPDAEVWVVVGDGGFQMTMCELATMVQEELDINIAIINNGYLGMVRQWQEFFYDKRYAATPISGPELREAGRGVRHRGGDRHDARARSPARSKRRAARSAPR